jgi:hypothetical protein
MEKEPEKMFYGFLKDDLENKFKAKFGSDKVFLQITADGNFDEKIKSIVKDDIVFPFLKKQVSPDITGFVKGEYGTDIVIAEFKKDKLTLQDIYQVKMYADLLKAKYVFLISLEPIPEELKRLQARYIIPFNTTYGNLKLAQFDKSSKVILENSWFPDSPFK